MNQVGANIRELRCRNGLSQEQLAGSLHLSRQALSNYEQGKRTPDLDILIKLAKTFDTTLDDIVGNI